MKLASKFMGCLVAVLCCAVLISSTTANAVVVQGGGSGNGTSSEESSSEEGDGASSSGGGDASSDSSGGNSSCGSTATFFDWGCSGDDDNQIMNVLATILNWLAIGVSAAVLIGIVYGAVMYASAGGNEAQTKKAIGIIRNAVIALLLYFGMWAILQYLIPGGVFA